jgi:hypothetical protein
MEMMHWYNPLTIEEEEVSAPMLDAQAIEMLSGHRDSDRFIEEYRIWREMQTDVVKPSSSRARYSTVSTGGDSPPGSSAPLLRGPLSLSRPLSARQKGTSR